MKRHWAFAALLAFALPLFLAFSWQSGLASLSDDSASYLLLAQGIAGINPAASAWVGYHSRFPPVFPMVLALTGAASDLRWAHAIVAAFAGLALVLIYRFALRETGRRDAAFLLVLAFLLCPTAWVSAKGILSEPMYLFASLACLAYFQDRFGECRPSDVNWLLLGLLLAITVLTRVVGAALVAALLLHVGTRSLATRTRPAARGLALAVLPSTVLVALWLALRPVAAEDTYHRVSTAMLGAWFTDPGRMAAISAASVFDGWVASFTADAGVGLAARVATAAIGLLGLAGLALRLRENRLDAWYVAVSLAIAFGWVFSEDNTRRLIYPLLPLLLLYAAQAVVWAMVRVGQADQASRAIGVAAAVMGIACVPASLLVFSKALDRAPVLVGFAPRYADITEYYTTLNLERSRALAAKHAAVLAGFEALGRATPAGARVMWMRPEYVALLGGREGVAWFYDWDAVRLAREVRDSRVDYLVVARLFKTDLEGRSGDPFETLRDVSAYARPVLALPNAVVGGDEFVLMQVDRVALDAALARAQRP